MSPARVLCSACFSVHAVSQHIVMWVGPQQVQELQINAWQRHHQATKSRTISSRDVDLVLGLSMPRGVYCTAPLLRYSGLVASPLLWLNNRVPHGARPIRSCAAANGSNLLRRRQMRGVEPALVPQRVWACATPLPATHAWHQVR